MKKTDSSTTPPWVNINPDPYVVQRILEVLAAQHGVAVDGAVREALNGTKTPDDRKEQLALAAGGDAYKAYWKALKVIVAELTADIDVSDVEKQAAQEEAKTQDGIRRLREQEARVADRQAQDEALAAKGWVKVKKEGSK